MRDIDIQDVAGRRFPARIGGVTIMCQLGVEYPLFLQYIDGECF